jgi:hypothetical protein
MSLAGKLIAFVGKHSAHRFDEATRDPLTIQTQLLLDMARKNASTEYGRRYGFASVKTIADYQRQVPIITYQDIQQDMERVVAGEKNIFTAEHPVMFAQTSGTTGKPKYIPVTPSDQGLAHKDQMRTWLYHAQKSHPGILDYKVVSMVSPAIEGYTSSGLPFGSTSGHIYKHMPALVRRAYSVPYEVFEIEDYQAKYYTIMRISLEHNVHFLATANPSSILQLMGKANEYSEDLIRDIRDGRLSGSQQIDAQIRQSVEKRLRPNPERARQLDQMRSRRNGRLIPADYWPELGLIGCWKGGTVGHYLEKFGDWFYPDGAPTVPIRDWGYLSSEARGSIPLSDEGSKGVLTVATNFFEFVAVDEVEAKPDASQFWPFLTAADLEMDKEYYIFVTTTSGLYRYDINDVIKVAGRYQQTPEIIFLRKGRGMTNITGEKLSVNQLIDAVQNAARLADMLPAHFKAEADTERSRYTLRVEFTAQSTQEKYLRFLQEVDRYLKSVNIEYKAKRESARLGAPVMHVMREGWYERGRRELAASGKRVFQAKTEVLSREKMETGLVRPEIEHIIELSE